MLHRINFPVQPVVVWQGVILGWDISVLSDGQFKTWFQILYLQNVSTHVKYFAPLILFSDKAWTLRMPWGVAGCCITNTNLICDSHPVAFTERPSKPSIKSPGVVAFPMSCYLWKVFGESLNTDECIKCKTLSTTWGKGAESGSR
jgi:hypothetical protein